MTRKMNKLGQYIPKIYNLPIRFIRTWLFILEYRLNIKEIVQKNMKNIF